MARLLFDFPPGPGASPVRRVFQDPVEVVRADAVDAVLPSLERIRSAVLDQGLSAAGFLSYEAAPAFDRAFRVRSGGRMPLLWFGLFEGTGEPAASPPPGSGIPSDGGDRPGSSDRFGPWELDVSRATFFESIDRIHRAIEAGETYQVNYTGRMRAKVQEKGSFRDVYARLRASQGDGYHALLELDGHTVVSASPELLFQLRGREVTVRPMKGTRPRGRWLGEDESLARELRSSEKERAENRMIVDLLRNDLGRVAETGSVDVASVFDVERYRTVLQMTSTITGMLPPGTDFVDAFGALFPSGSVTGAPKIRTMEIIADLEASPREVYCGSVGYVEGGSGDAVFNVPIRTLWIDEESEMAVYGTGSGVTWSSTAAHEYEEVRAKARVLTERWPAFDLLETVRLEHGGYLRLPLHLSRMEESARYFDRLFPEDALRSALDATARGHREGAWKVRLLLSEEGEVEIEAEEILDEPLSTAEAPPRPVALASVPVHSENRWLFHKTTHRSVYEERRRNHPGAFDVLLRNEKGQVTEFTTGNVVLEIGGRRVTPPRRCGLLAGCFRRELLERDLVVEEVVSLSELRDAERMWLVNSVRGWIPVELSRSGPSAREEPETEATEDGPDEGTGI